MAFKLNMYFFRLMKTAYLQWTRLMALAMGKEGQSCYALLRNRFYDVDLLIYLAARGQW